MKTEEERVAAGARLMDRILPGWHKVVNLDKLFMNNGSLCLLGQTFGVHAERSLAKEMYPEEWEESCKKTDYPRNTNAGFFIASGRHNAGGMVPRILFKLRIKTEMLKEYKALECACKGHDNKCQWADEIASRLAKDEDAKSQE